MKVSQRLTCFGLAVAFSLYTGNSWAFITEGGKIKTSIKKDDNPRYKLHAASSLSGINVRPNKATGTFILKFDQQLPESGILQVKNTAGKVLYSGILTPVKGQTTHTLDIGRLNPGVYAIEVKTSDATFWKKIRIYK